MFATDPGYEALQAFTTSVGIGLLIGLERERQSDSKAGLVMVIGGAPLARRALPGFVAIAAGLVGGLLLASTP